MATIQKGVSPIRARRDEATARLAAIRAEISQIWRAFPDLKRPARAGLSKATGPARAGSTKAYFRRRAGSDWRTATKA